METALGMLALVLVIAFVALVVYLPRKIATKRGNPHRDAITVCSVVGILFWPAWLVAIIWAYAGDSRSSICRR